MLSVSLSFRHQVNVNRHAQHITCVDLQQSRTMSHFALSFLCTVTGLEAIWGKYGGTFVEMINDGTAGF